MRIDELSSDAFRDAVGKGCVAIIPLGATEAHGAHLPLGTDTFQPEYVVKEIERIAGDKVLIAPTLPYGQHSTARNLPGTMDISFDTLRSVIGDLVGSLIRHGIRRIIIISGHAGTSHMTAVNEACRKIAETHPDVDIRFFSDFDIAASCDMPPGDGHAGHTETSRMLHIRSDLVNEKRPSGRYASTEFRILGDASICMPDGVVGDTKNASADFGRKVNKYIIDKIIEMIA